MTPPLRFLAVSLGGWAAARSLILAAPWAGAAPVQPPGRPAQLPAVASFSGADLGTPAFALVPAPLLLVASEPLQSHTALPVPQAQAAAPPLEIGTTAFDLALVPRLERVRSYLPPAPPATRPAVPTPAAAASRWSVSAFLFARGGVGGRSLAPGGTLGGSQAGARILYRLNGNAARPLSLAARLYAPGTGLAGAEAAAGVEWQPLRVLPVRLLAERREALGTDGRSAFALTLHGGFTRRVAGPVQLDAYAQAGAVGARSPDLFADGSIRASAPVALDGRLSLGAAAWAAAQPGVSRIDAGPSLRLALPVQDRTVTIAADWRLRLAGDAAPPSGPALTLASDF
jgi:hypothetical protein